MKKTLFKDTLRSISANKLRFLSIIVIVALGIGFFIGIKSASPAMGYSANEYFRISNLLDVRVTSKVAFSQEDIEKIEKLDKVDYIVRSKYVDAIVGTGGEALVDSNGVELTCRISSFDVAQAVGFTQTGEADDYYVNRLALKAGRYPEKKGECVIDAAAVQNYPDIEIGSVLEFQGDGEKITDRLIDEKLMVVGTVESPIFISSDRGTTQVGSGALGCFAYVSEDEFSTDEINELFIKIKYDDIYDKFSDEYKAIVDNLSAEIKNMSSEIIDSKLSDLKIEYSSRIDEKQAEIDAYNESSALEISAKQKEIDEFKAYVDSEDEILTQQKESSEKEKSTYKTERDRFSTDFNTLSASYETNVKNYENQSSEIKGYSDWKTLYDDLNTKHATDKQNLAALEAAKNSAQADYDSKKVKLDNATENKNSAESSITALTDEIKSLNEEITNLEADVKSKDADIQRLESEIKEHEAKIAEYEAKETLTFLERLDYENEKTLLKEKNNELTSVRNTKANIQKEIEKKKETITKKESEIELKRTDAAFYEKLISTVTGEVNTASSQLTTANNNYTSAKKLYDDDTKTLEKYSETMKQLTSGESKLVELSKTIEEQNGKLESLKIRLTQAQIKYSISVRNGDLKVQKAQYDLDSAKARYYTIDSELTELKEKVEKNKSSLNNEIKKLQNTLKNIDSITWMPTALTALSGYEAFESSMENILSMSDIFPIIFLVTAMIACFVIMMKNVEEERGSIGLLKAFGYFNRAIINKYVFYALLAWLGGAFFGGVFGTCVVPSAVYSIFDIAYIVPNVGAVFNFKFILTGILISFAITMAATFMAVVRELKMYPAALMRPKMIGYNRRSILERLPEFWGALPYGIVLLIRTVIRSRKRVAVGSVAIACCTALILSAFGLYNSVNDVSDSQYGDSGIFRYDVQLVLNAQQYPEDSAILEKVRADKLVNSAMLISNNSMAISASEEKAVFDSVKVVVPSEMENLSNYIDLEIIFGSANLKGGGVVLSQKLARDMDVSEGDVVYLTDSDEIVHSVKVDGVVKNYIEHYAYISPEAYEEIFMTAPEYKYLLCSLKDYMDTQDVSDFAAGYLKSEDVAGVATSEMMADAADTAIDQVMILVVLFVLSACLLAMIVMYTTSNVNISERTHEIANIKVIGFSDGEVLLYVIRENIVSTVIGTVIGLVGGIFLHKVLVNLISVETVLYGTSVSWWSFIVAALIIIFVAVLASLPILFKINKVNMAETLKSVE